MKAFQEITAWDSDFAVPNHVYFLSDGRDKMYGYVRASDGVVQTMRTPYRFHVRGRKFREVENVWNFGMEEEVSQTRGKEHKVLGSRGNVYTVTDEGGAWSCTCPASKYQKGDCKHITALKSETR